jgi:sigma-E factor negative regulatory protein RseA
MKNQLSALIDGELDIESSEHLITSAKSGGELKTTWASYHLIGDAMRGDLWRGDIGPDVGSLHHDFTSRVMAALEADPTVLMPKVALDDAQNAGNVTPITLKKSVYKPSGFWSVAASFAAVMFVGVMVLQQQFSKPAPVIIVKAEQPAKVEALAPIEIAQSVPTEYLQAHHAAAPTSAAYYIQDANFVEPNK